MAREKRLINIINVLELNETLHSLFRYNLMTKDIEFTRKISDEITEWRHGEYLTDEDLVHLKHYLSIIMPNEYDKKSIEEAVMITSKRRAYNPLTNYLNKLVWDGESRIDRWLIDLCGSPDNNYIRTVSRKFMCGAVARALEPGCKFDYMLILEGEQGIGKSTLVEVLGGKWYLDTHLCGSDNKKDLIDIMRTAWIIEISDMAGFRKSDLEYLKAFITRKVDRIRLPYDRRSQDFPRQCIMIGTHNPSGSNEYFRDDTGNRRFWPVECKYADYHRAADIRDQLFAEAVIKLREGESLFLEDNDVLNILFNMQEERSMKNPYDSILEEYTSGKYSVTIVEIIQNALECNINRMQAKDLRGKQTIVGIWLRKKRFRKQGNIYINPKFVNKPVAAEEVWNE